MKSSSFHIFFKWFHDSNECNGNCAFWERDIKSLSHLWSMRNRKRGRRDGDAPKNFAKLKSQCFFLIFLKTKIKTYLILKYVHIKSHCVGLFQNFICNKPTQWDIISSSPSSHELQCIFFFYPKKLIRKIKMGFSSNSIWIVLIGIFSSDTIIA